ncbi:LOW QUALITY PROTEIN: hypothetical protein TorRG33x02_025460 [Trema orientale]|uniref:Uncharacterized protein n=1 Tax=Trema orientale TaxID=63057 RepID=A0A2P5FVF5_TREOI|nr:LOW QUALITY PROTEIN: hypothetical protein TorRG33x02_025460 [Trema orientale]
MIASLRPIKFPCSMITTVLLLSCWSSPHSLLYLHSIHFNNRQLLLSGSTIIVVSDHIRTLWLILLDTLRSRCSFEPPQILHSQCSSS